MRIATLIAGALLLLGLATATPPSDTPALNVSTTIVPARAGGMYELLRIRPGMYRATLHVAEEPANGPSWTTNVVIAPGGKGKTSGDFRDLHVDFEAKLASTVDHAETKVTITRAGKVVLNQSSTVWLQRTR
jgi:hypothetical protein